MDDIDEKKAELCNYWSNIQASQSYRMTAREN